MKKIPLTQDKFALVDDEDYKWLNQRKWYAIHIRKDYWYAARSNYIDDWKKPNTIRMHREILGLKKGNDKKTDHKDGNGLNNQRYNLRCCTVTQNGQNRKIQKHSSSFKGVNWNKRNKKWQTSIRYNKKFIWLGRFNSEIKAAKAYDAKAKELFGEFAYTNF
jgi:hypothetical protein